MRTGLSAVAGAGAGARLRITGVLTMRKVVLSFLLMLCTSGLAASAAAQEMRVADGDV